MSKKKKDAEFLRLLNAAVDRPREGVIRYSTVMIVTGSLGPDPAPNMVFPLRPDRETVIDFPKYGYRVVKVDPE